MNGTLAATIRVRAAKTAILGCVLFVISTLPHHTSSAAEAPVPLGTTASFAVLAGTRVTNSGQSIIWGNVGVSPGTNVGGFPSGAIRGTNHINNATARTAQTNLTTAYNDAAGRPNTPVFISGDIGGSTLTPGLYAATSSLEISSADLTLDAQGDPTAVFIFQIISTFTTAPGRKVILSGGARAANIFWQVGDSADIGANSVVAGNILANQTITFGARASLDGRALARMGEVVLNANVITTPLGGTTNDLSLDVAILTPITLNPQTGLFEQTIRANNSSTNAVNALAVLIRGLPSDARVYNASGTDPFGTPFVAQPVAVNPGESVDFVIEYYRANRQPLTQPTFSPAATTARPRPPKGEVISVDRTVQLQSGRFLIEFTATVGRRYLVQYSPDMAAWTNANPTITAAADRVQWLDDGPPKTVSPPSGLGSRFYRVFELP
jgi:hypothetical protein